MSTPSPFWTATGTSCRLRKTCVSSLPLTITLLPLAGLLLGLPLETDAIG